MLFLALQRRWRVNFGVNPSPDRLRRVAVPFRAKDVAAEKTEFGHPDVAIILTQISYYNSGLTSKQLDDAFAKLQNMSNADGIYKSWITDVLDAGIDVPTSVRELCGVNLFDFEQRTEVLYPLLAKNMRVIDFWLGTVVFPLESKQFPNKISTSAWDLCLKSGHPITGFSGTNDSKMALPLTIQQHDLDELIGTNGSVVRKLLLPNNQTYNHLQPCASGSDVLKYVVEQENVRILLDAGALVIELSNEEFAHKWLKMDLEAKAAVFFNDDNQLMVIDSDERITSFELSPFRERLEDCVVYLDDAHTRGTDLKLPYNSHACVTLGKGLSKDKLVQACMRMRLLGEGQTVSFLASMEVHSEISTHHIKKTNNDNDVNDDIVNTASVLRWTLHNSCETLASSFLHWAGQGISRFRKEAAFHILLESSTLAAVREFGKLCIEDEIYELKEFYAIVRKAQPIPKIVRRTIRRLIAELENRNTANRALDKAKKSCELLVDRCDEYVHSTDRFAQMLDEEQERELEQELEEERHVERPKKATAHIPKRCSLLEQYVTRGSFYDNAGQIGTIFRVHHMFNNTKVWKLIQSNGWDENIFATKEFITVVKNSKTCDDYVRELSWVLEFKEFGCISKLLLISPFEANYLIPYLRCRSDDSVQLHMFLSRVLNESQNILYNSPSLCIPCKPSSCQIGSLEVQHEDKLVRGDFLAELMVLSGSLFFENASEQRNYCNFLGLCPRPRNERLQKLLDSGHISRDGFVIPENREFVNRHMSKVCHFRDDPIEMVLTILHIHGHKTDSSLSHVGRVLLRSHKHSFDDDDDDNDENGDDYYYCSGNGDGNGDEQQQQQQHDSTINDDDNETKHNDICVMSPMLSNKLQQQQQQQNQKQKQKHSHVSAQEALLLKIMAEEKAKEEVSEATKAKRAKRAAERRAKRAKDRELKALEAKRKLEEEEAKQKAIKMKEEEEKRQRALEVARKKQMKEAEYAKKRLEAEKKRKE
eukprot:TRINITY_DN295_c3_g1_i1.p1 TRINITY_DN295_c3_g1~~TRINITY_DN295_c3_g1_i1.p1  ORF type:complete len:1002 (-),score=369.10 TRINITY_DN295_c3_g1_i1:614-3583(-)